MPGIYGSKQTEPEGIAEGQGLFTTAINLGFQVYKSEWTEVAWLCEYAVILCMTINKLKKIGLDVM